MGEEFMIPEHPIGVAGDRVVPEKCLIAFSGIELCFGSTMKASNQNLTLTLVLVAGVLTACGRYYSKFNFRGIPIAGAATTYALVIDSDMVRDRIRTEELRQAEEIRRIRELPAPEPKDGASARAWLEASHKLIDLHARAVLLSDLRAMASFDVPSTAQGTIVGWSVCQCTQYQGSFQRLVRVRFKLRTGRTVEGWICQDAIQMLHNFDL